VVGVGARRVGSFLIALADAQKVSAAPAPAIPIAIAPNVKADVVTALMNFGAKRLDAQSAADEAAATGPGDFDSMFRRASALVGKKAA
jgi:hypothetical protein